MATGTCASTAEASSGSENCNPPSPIRHTTGRCGCAELGADRGRQAVAERAVAGAGVEIGARARRLVDLVGGIDRLGLVAGDHGVGQRFRHRAQQPAVDAAGGPQAGRHLLAEIGRACGALAVGGRRRAGANPKRRVERGDRQPGIGLDRQIGRQVVHQLQRIDVDADQLAGDLDRRAAPDTFRSRRTRCRSPARRRTAAAPRAAASCRDCRREQAGGAAAGCPCR